jgi:hypothetical protein
MKFSREYFQSSVFLESVGRSHPRVRLMIESSEHLPPPPQAFVEVPAKDGSMLRIPKGFYTARDVQTQVGYSAMSMPGIEEQERKKNGQLMNREHKCRHSSCVAARLTHHPARCPQSHVIIEQCHQRRRKGWPCRVDHQWTLLAHAPGHRSD